MKLLPVKWFKKLNLENTNRFPTEIMKFWNSFTPKTNFIRKTINSINFILQEPEDETDLNSTRINDDGQNLLPEVSQRKSFYLEPVVFLLLFAGSLVGKYAIIVLIN